MSGMDKTGRAGQAQSLQEILESGKAGQQATVPEDKPKMSAGELASIGDALKDVAGTDNTSIATGVMKTYQTGQDGEFIDPFEGTVDPAVAPEAGAIALADAGEAGEVDPFDLPASQMWDEAGGMGATGSAMDILTDVATNMSSQTKK